MIKDTIRDAVSEITNTCQNEDVFVTNEDQSRMPSRGVIIGILKDLRRIVFPGYFGDENISSSMPDYFLGIMMTEV